MRAYFNMPTSEFVAQLRDIAVKAGARAQVIDCLDAIEDAPSEEEIRERESASYEDGLRECRNEWTDSLEEAVGKLEELELTPKQLEQVLNIVHQIDPIG